MKVGAILGLNSPKVPGAFPLKFKEYLNYAGLSKLSIQEEADKFSMVYKVPTLLGMEVEVEHAKSEVSLPFFWSADGDGSLRHHGVEFKSIPLDPSQAFLAILLLWNLLKNKKADFSWRTSIHFHVNVLDLEEEELNKLTLLALVLEPALFKVAGVDREQSNFCVPLCRSTILEMIQKRLSGKTSLKTFFVHWNSGHPSGDGPNGLFKYAAINFSRLGDLGTMEFRHFGGCSDINKIMQFMAMILKLYEAAVTHTMAELRASILLLDSPLAYSAFMNDILGSKLAVSVDFEEITGSIARVKEILVERPKFDPVSENSSIAGYGEVVRKRRTTRKEAAHPAKKSKIASNIAASQELIGTISNTTSDEVSW